MAWAHPYTATAPESRGNPWLQSWKTPLAGYDASILRVWYSLCHDRLCGLGDLSCKICTKGIAVAAGVAIRSVVHGTLASNGSWCQMDSPVQWWESAEM